MNAKELLIEMVDDIIDAAVDVGKESSGDSGRSIDLTRSENDLNEAVEKFHTFLATLKIRGTEKFELKKFVKGIGNDSVNQPTNRKE